MCANDSLTAPDASVPDKRGRALPMSIGLLERARATEERNMVRCPLKLLNGGASANAESTPEVVPDTVVGMDRTYFEKGGTPCF